MQDEHSHGHSTAAWTGVVTIMVGSLVMALSVIFPSVAFFIVGVVLCVAGVAAGKVLSMMGYGDKASSHASARGENGPVTLPGKSQHDSGTA